MSIACGAGSGTTATAGGPSSSTTTSVVSTTTSAAPRQPCTPANLDAAAQAQFPRAKSEDVTCSAAYAVATLTGVSRGTGVGYFGTQPDGSWVLLNVGALDGDLTADTPAGMPSALPAGWRAKYDSRVRRASQPPSEVNSSSEYGDVPPYIPPPEPPPTEPPPPEPVPEEPPPAELPPEQ